jgi:hypothetical protein
VSYSCQMNNRLDLGGQPVWTYWSGACAGGGGSTSVVRVK